MRRSLNPVVITATVLFLALHLPSPMQASDGIDVQTATFYQSKLPHTIKPLGTVRAPLGLQIFCVTQRAHCATGGKARAEMTTDLMRALERINTRVNKSIRPQHDANGDVWSVNVTVGDCEDYALTKRARLAGLGVPINALRIATAYTRSGEAHAVLILRSDQGDLVLDNRHNAIRHWHQTDLNWIAISGDSLSQWHKI